MSTDGLGQYAPCVAILDKIDFILRVEPLSEGVDRIEPLLEDLLQKILRNPGCHDFLRQKLFDLLDTLPGGAVEIVQYCMHELRWNEVRAYAEHRFKVESGVVCRRALERIIESFDRDWSERTLYDRYEAEGELGLDFFPTVINRGALGHNYDQVFNYPWVKLPNAYTGL